MDSSRSARSVRKSREYVESMPYEDVKRYAGQWLALIDGEIVAHGRDPSRVFDEAWDTGKGEPYMRYMYAGLSEVPFLFYAP